jgi:hypothetical protein
MSSHFAEIMGFWGNRPLNNFFQGDSVKARSFEQAAAADALGVCAVLCCREKYCSVTILRRRNP